MEQSKIKVKVQGDSCQSIIFRSTDGKPPAIGDVADKAIFMMSLICYRNNHKYELPQKRHVIGGIYDVI